MVEPEARMQDDALSDMGEIRRQLGNSYALLRSIIRSSAESATSVENFAWHLEGRLDVIGRIMLAVMRKPGAGFDLCHLINDELSDQNVSDSAHAWTLEGPSVALDAAAAEVLGLLFHELVTNSIEHGVLGRDEGGELQVIWRVEAADDGSGAVLRLDWTEGGAPATLDREGFGSIVLDGMLRYQLDGTAEREFGSEGVRISLTVPMRNLLRDDAWPGPDQLTA